MIHFSLLCDSGHAFEGWFRNTGDFDTQAEAGHLACPVCGGTAVRKALMAPNVSTSRKKAAVAESGSQAPADEKNEDLSVEPETADSAQTAVVAQSAKADALATLAIADPRQSEIVEVLRKLRDTVIRNTDDVGKGFAEEARKMHYGEAEKRGIRGETSPQEVRELSEDGIDVMPLPALPEDKN